MSETMSLDDAIASESPRPKKGPACWIVRAEVQFGDDWPKLADLLEKVREGERTAASLSRILNKAGFRISGNQVSRHIRNDCGCNDD